MRPWVLDLCCGAGGFSAGLYAAGFNVVGVDITTQPDYPFPFVLADALTVPLDGFAAIVASPPCQRWSTATHPDRRGSHPDVLTPLRGRLLGSVVVPWILENVPGAPLRSPVRLCGTTLRLGVRRHRLFESNVPLHGTPCVHDDPARPVAVYGSYGATDGTTASRGRAAMDSPWMPWPALVQSIPPAYGMFLGAQLWAHIGPGPFTVPSLIRDATVQEVSVTTVTTDIGARDGSDQVMPQTSRYVIDRGSSVTVAPLCRHCGGRPVSRPETGRWGRYCSHACRQAAYRVREAAQGRKR